MTPSDVNQVLGGGSCQRVGSFRFTLSDQRWEWSDAVAAMHGYLPGAVTPTTELLLTHKHPDDRDEVAATLTETVENGEPFCSSHRIVDTAGRVHHVLVVADRELGVDGEPVGTSGFYIEVDDDIDDTADPVHDAAQRAGDAAADMVRSRAAIEQAKGALMLVYGINADRAFDVLTWRSQESNVKLRPLVHRHEQVVEHRPQACRRVHGMPAHRCAAAPRRSVTSAANASRRSSAGPRRTADGWTVANTAGSAATAASSPRRSSSPRCAVTRNALPSNDCAAVAPSTTSTRGCTSSSSASSHGRHATISVRPGFW